MPEALYFLTLPADASPAWKTFFSHADAYMGSAEALMGRSKSAVRENRQICLDNMQLTNDFDAYLSAEAGKDRGNEYFREGKLGRAMGMYLGSLVLMPLPSTFLNCAAVSLRQQMWGIAEHFCTLALKMEDILSPATKAKALYRRAVANRLQDHEGRSLRTALTDIKAAHELSPENADVAREMSTIERMLTLGFAQLKRTIQQQRDAYGPLNPDYVTTDEDGRAVAVEQRVQCTRRYPASFSYQTTGPSTF
ncbi:hypothetical protein FB451DRAFT_1556198 [Mycena latifolia]|nr:hypothetical protein FB451DRAFT_1556198 [Mycena latifolia]